MDEIDTQIVRYFSDGFAYMEIIEFLRVHHQYFISLSTLKRRLRTFGIRRRALATVRCSHGDLVDAIRHEMYGSGSLIGYRRMHCSMLSKNTICRREDVRKVMKDLDPEGVFLRRRRRLKRRRYNSKGPNHVWHIDGHDKLKPFGFSIHGCIDGFSRKLIWLKIGPSNKIPEIIAKYYLDAIKEYGVPAKVKADDGTEHSLIEPIHIYLRSLNEDDAELSAFSITTSPLNQRIEAFWSVLQRDRIGWWRIFFKDLVDMELFSNDNPLFVECIRFCFMHLLREDLTSVANEWNAHLISGKNQIQGGRPDTMFFLPHLYSKENHAKDADLEEVSEMYPNVTLEQEDYSIEFGEFAGIVMEENGYVMPNTPSEALSLYIFLLQNILEYS